MYTEQQQYQNTRLNKVKFAILVFSIGKNGQIVRKYYEFVKIFLKIFWKLEKTLYICETE